MTSRALLTVSKQYCKVFNSFNFMVMRSSLWIQVSDKRSDPIKTIANRITWRWLSTDLAMSKWSQEVIKQFARHNSLLRSILEIEIARFPSLSLLLINCFMQLEMMGCFSVLCLGSFFSKQSVMQHWLLSWQASLNTGICNGSLCSFHPRLHKKQILTWNPT